LVRAQRAVKGLTQADLARAAKVSADDSVSLGAGERVSGTDGRSRPHLRGVGGEPKIVDRSAPDEARQQARLEQQQKLEQQRSRHLRLVIKLADDAQAAARMIAKARERVELWRRKGTCSPYYIERWSRLLRLGPRKIAREMASLGEWEDAMFQNSPWSWAWS
jgi:hypothetical protein